MDKKTTEEIETQFNDLIGKPPIQVDELLALVGEANAAKADELSVALLRALSEAGDFPGAFKAAKARGEAIAAKSGIVAVRDALKKATQDRTVASFLDAAMLATRSWNEAFARLERLLQFQPGARVLSQAWGLGEVKRIDNFYRRITVDFRLRHGHQFTYDAACETLVPAPEDHVLVIARADEARVQKWLKDEPGEFVKQMLKSFGDMPITRLEELSAQHGFVKAANWKKFWDAARADLKKDKLVEIPTRRAEPLHLKASAETYGDGWLTAFAQNKDPKSILSSVRELQGNGKFKTLDEATRGKIAERLAFALKGARGADDALYARIAFAVAELKLDDALAAKARAYLWEHSRYLAAARELPARETGSLVVFLTAENREETKHKLFAAIPEMCFPLLTETLMFFMNDMDCQEAVAAMMKSPHPPATLVTCILGRYDKFVDAKWAALPPLVVILSHAIALGEGKQTGETLRMQNVVRRLFADSKWLEGIFAMLTEKADRLLFFERFQASLAWDPSTHHMITVRMTHVAPELAAHQVKVAAPKKEEARVTSVRSYNERKAAYQKLVNVDIPKNAHDIDVARSYGDLRENFEYQSAKDEQRALLQKQTLMQEELNAVKPVDFSDVVADEVRAGTMVTVALADGVERVYTVLGEWDNDLENNVIANRTKLAQNMLGKKAGDTFDLPDAEGNVSVATVKAVAALNDAMKAWVKGE